MRAIDRLIEYIDYKSLTNASFEKEVGLSNGYVRKLKSGKGSIGSDVLEKIVNSFVDLSLYWLVAGEGEMLKGKDKEQLTSHQENLYKSIATAQNDTIRELRETLSIQQDVIRGFKSASSPTSAQ